MANGVAVLTRARSPRLQRIVCCLGVNIPRARLSPFAPTQDPVSLDSDGASCRLAIGQGLAPLPCAESHESEAALLTVVRCYRIGTGLRAFNQERDDICRLQEDVTTNAAQRTMMHCRRIDEASSESLQPGFASHGCFSIGRGWIWLRRRGCPPRRSSDGKAATLTCPMTRSDGYRTLWRPRVCDASQNLSGLR